MSEGPLSPRLSPDRAVPCDAPLLQCPRGTCTRLEASRTPAARSCSLWGARDPGARCTRTREQGVGSLPPWLPGSTTCPAWGACTLARPWSSHPGNAASPGLHSHALGPSQTQNRTRSSAPTAAGPSPQE